MVDKIDWKKVLEANGKGVTVRERNHVDYLIDGSQAFQAMYDAITTAFSSNGSSGYYIYLLRWWLDDTLPLTGKPGSSILELFRAASLVRNVQIRVMLYDHAFSKQNTEQIRHISELPTGVGILDDTTLPIRNSGLPGYLPLTQISRHFEPTGAHHQKVLIVKGQHGLIGFCGGIDINQDRTIAVKRSPGSPYHDVHCRIEGDAVPDLVHVFVQRWLAHPEHMKLDNEVKKGEKALFSASLTALHRIRVERQLATASLSALQEHTISL